MRCALGENASKRKENTKNRYMMLRFLSMCSRDPYVADTLISAGFHVRLGAAFEDLSKAKDYQVCDHSLTAIPLCGPCTVLFN